MNKNQTPNEGFSMRCKLFLLAGILVIAWLCITATLTKNSSNLLADNESSVEHDEVIFGSNNGRV